MQTQNENLDSQNADGRHEPVSEGPCSGEHWQQLENLLEKKPDKPVRPAPNINKDIQLCLGGALATITVLATCQYGAGVYSRVLDNALFVPAASLIDQAVARTALHAQRSTITGIIDRDTMTSSLYWTLDLKNTSGAAREATAELKLPEGAVVSRATLWINGVPQEAAFNTTQQVANAYNWITVRHRDPLLVTYKDKHTVLIKASPVPANGDIMKIRLGITAPLAFGANGNSALTLPEIKEANFSLPDKNDVHIQSPTWLECDGPLKFEHTNLGFCYLKGSMPASDLSKVTIDSYRADGQGNFAIRATHSQPGTYIFSKVNDIGDDQATSLSRKQESPHCRIVRSEHAAHRVSTLWASREIDRLLAQGKRSEAEDLASVYRVVSPVSGAVVLELDSDYTRMQLHRDQYMVSVPGKRPIASRYPQPAPSFVQPGTANAPVLQGAVNNTIAPQASDNTVVLQGAVNGTIAPQGADGGPPSGPVSAAANWLVASSRDANLFDSTPSTAVGAPLIAADNVIQGVNTTGTVRVNNLANLESLISILANACDVGFFIAALFFAYRGLRKTISSGLKAGIRDQLIAVSLVCCGTLWLIALPLIATCKILRFAGRKLKLDSASKIHYFAPRRTTS